VADFYATASARLGGQMSSAEAQALSAMNGWADDAKTALLSSLDPTGASLLSVAMQGAADIAHGVSPESFFAIGALAATTMAGPVAGAVVGALGVGLQVASQLLMSVARVLGIAASTVPVDNYCGFFDITKNQLIPWGPSDAGDGTYANPGWIDSWKWIEDGMRTGAVYHCIDCNALGWCNAPHCPGPPVIAPFTPLYTAYGVQVFNQYLVAKNLEGGATVFGHVLAPRAMFETFLIPMIFANADLANNCSPVQQIPLQLMLVHALDVWNATHEPGEVRTVGPRTSNYDHQFNVLEAILAGELGGATSLPPVTIHTGGVIHPAAAVPPPPPHVVRLRLRSAGVDIAKMSGGAPAAGSSLATPLILAAGALGVLAVVKPQLLRKLMARVGLRI
jgi:hypothetical protein